MLAVMGERVTVLSKRDAVFRAHREHRGPSRRCRVSRRRKNSCSGIAERRSCVCVARVRVCGIARRVIVFRRAAGLLIALATTMATTAVLARQSARIDQPQVAAVQVETPEKRFRYLATAEIWADPGELTPDALRAGPPLDDGSGVEAALDGRAFPCTFAQPGKTMGGATPKFMCRTAAGRTIRLKYSDGSKGNKEVFSAVAASRLLWALGFKADPIYPVSIDCQDCPEDPMSGKRAEGAAFVPRDLSTENHRSGDR